MRIRVLSIKKGQVLRGRTCTLAGREGRKAEVRNGVVESRWTVRIEAGEKFAGH